MLVSVQAAERPRSLSPGSASRGGSTMMAAEPNRRPPLIAAAREVVPVAFATLARGDVLEIGGRRQPIAALLQTRGGFVVQFPDTATMQILCPPEVRTIDGRALRLDDIPPRRCLWCHHHRRLVAVGRYTTESGRTVVVYACTACVGRHRLLPLGFRASTDTEVRRRSAPP
ncbi:hypothetical protein PJ985_10880 [Streptomyces sp. ACA25]|uniref:hypothetical protein n=1 Tax=Streptomyces sp. ACA25 TaxID=3022596 RepID=UPI0023074466|nr:hypothetical protein [Streptomyces sp. ACA25]MDB1088069.1 hypothetical protein [Streptomyces sp. ACA25]